MIAETFATLALVVPVGFREAPLLEPAASYVAGKPVAVLCGPTPGGEAGLAYPGASEVSLSDSVCIGLRAILARRDVGDGFAAAALRVLAHEAVHASGVRDESETECAAIKRVAGMAARYFGFKTWRARHFLMSYVWASHRLLPDAYRRLC